MRRSSCRSSRLSVSGRLSMNTGLAPRSTNAFTVDTKVKDGTMTSSPGLMSSNSADISSACVHDVVNSADETGKRFSSHSRQRLVKGPSPERCRCRRSEEHTSELQSHHDLVCRLLLEKKKIYVFIILTRCN